jgi:glycerol-3-phosphate dehydrogenase subunit C
VLGAVPFLAARSVEQCLGDLMTITYDPKHPKYFDEADVRDELTRVFDVCHGCRLCVTFCSAFPTLFEMIDRHDDQDAGRLTPAQQDQVVDECFQCKLCYINCPYIPALHELAIDFPRLMLRSDAMRHVNGQVSIRHRVTDSVLGHTDLLGRAATLTAPVANKLLGAKQGSVVRKAMEKVTGVSSVRLLSPVARQRFTTWFKRRPRVRIARRQGRVAIFPTCLVEYQQPSIGHDLVKVYERNGIECSLVDSARCCGAPWLHSGDVEQFTKVAEKNVATLAASVRRGNDIVVPQPTCGYVLKKDYVDYVGGPDAQLVAEHTYDAAEYLMKVHKADGTTLDTAFDGEVPATVTYHTPCHLKAQNIGLKSRDLIKLTGAKVTVVQQCSGVDGMWGLRAENAGISVPIAQNLADQIRRANSKVIAGDCHLANTAITEQTGQQPLHPLQLMARAYGISEEVPQR